jgi:sec-independent protein translocase protein TatA
MIGLMTAETVTFAMLGWMEIMVIALVVLLFFGAKRLPDIFKGMGQGIKEFKKATREVSEDVQRAMEEEPPPPPRKAVPPPAESKSASSGNPPESKA